MEDYYYDICRICYDAVVNRSLNYFEFINAIVDLVAKENNLTEYIKKVNLFNEEVNQCFSRARGLYSGNKKRILINGPKISRESKHDEHLYNFRYEEKLFFFHLNTVRTLFHEIEHAKQKKISLTDTDEYDIETDIIKTVEARRINNYKIQNNTEFPVTLKIFSQLYSNRENRIYHKFYNFSPIERLAQIRAYDEIIKIAHLLEFEELELFYRYKGFCETLKGYDFNYVTAPTIFYLVQNNNFAKVEELNYKSQDMELIARLLYGLIITEDEFFLISEEIDQLERTLINHKFDINKLRIQ